MNWTEKLDGWAALNWQRVRFAGIVLAVFMLAVIASALYNAASADGLNRSGKVADTSASILPLSDVGKAVQGSWTGVYLGVGLGYQIADTNLDLNVDTPQGSGSLLEIDGLSGRGWGYDGRLGFDWQIPGSAFVVGILGGYRGGETEFNVNTDLGNLGNVLNATMRQTWYAGGRVGIAHGQALYYVGGAWTQGEMDISIPVAPNLCGNTAGLNCSPDVDGYMLLAGMEAKLAPQWTVGLEYTLTRFDTANIFSADFVPNSNLSLDTETDIHAFMVRLNYRPMSK